MGDHMEKREKKSNSKEKKKEKKKEKMKKEEEKAETVIPMEDTKDEEAKRKEESQRAYESNYEAEEKDWNRAWKILKNTITITMPCIFGEEGKFHYKTLIAYTLTVLGLLFIWVKITNLQQEIFCCYYVKILGIIGIDIKNPGCEKEDDLHPVCT